MRGGGGQGGCERRIKVFVKIQKKKIFFFWGGGGSGEGGYERRIKVFVKIKKIKIGGGGRVRGGGGREGGWVKVDVNEKLKFL